MRFDRQTTPPPWLNRRSQYRLLGLITLLLLVLLAVDAARKPENWNWFFVLQGHAPNSEAPLKEIDFRALGEPASSETITQAPDAEPTSEELPEDMPDIHYVPARLLQNISDQRVGRLHSEEGALTALLHHADEYSTQQLFDAGRRDVGFRAINVEPDAFRGQLISLTGTLWKLAPYAAPDTDPGRRLYQAWLFTSDSGDNPWVVLLTEKPTGIEEGEQLDRQVQTAGYFFKRYGYATRDGLHVAPMLVGRSLEPVAALAHEQMQTDSLSRYLAGVLAATGLLFGGMVWWFVRSDRRFRGSKLARIAESRMDAPPEAVARLNELKAEEVADTLRELEQRSS